MCWLGEFWFFHWQSTRPAGSRCNRVNIQVILYHFTLQFCVTKFFLTPHSSAIKWDMSTLLPNVTVILEKDAGIGKDIKSKIH